MGKRKKGRSHRPTVQSDPALTVPKTDAGGNTAAEISRSKRVVMLLIPVLSSFLVYLNTVPNGFVFDDQMIIENNLLIRDLGNIKEIFTTNYWQSINRNAGLYRPITVFTYSINYAFGELNPSGYHFVNIVLHATVTFFVGFIVLLLAGSPVPALFAGLIFALHPIHVEAVANIVGRAELLSTLFCLVMLTSYHLAARVNNPVRSVYYWLSLGAFFLALLSKENAVTFLIAPLLYDLLYGDRVTGQTVKRSVKSKLTTNAGFFVVFFVFLLIRTKILGVFTPPDIAPLDNPLTKLSTGERCLGAISIFGRYLQLFIFPQNLSSDYGFDVLPFTEFGASPLFWIGLLSLSVLLAGLLYCLIRHHRLPALFLFLFFISYSIISNIIVVIGTPMAERLYYLPSVGLCLLAGYGVGYLAESLGERTGRRAVIIGILLISIIVPYSWRTWNRNRDWKSNFDLYLADVKTVPNSAKLRKVLASAFLKRDRPEEAILHLEAAISIFPNYSDAYLGLADAYARTGNKSKNREMVQKARDLSPRNVRARVAMGRIYVNEGKPELAIGEFKEALKLDTALDIAWYYMANAYYNLRDYDQVISSLHRDLRLTSQGRAQQFYLLGSSYQNLKNYPKAVEAYREGLNYNQNSTDILEQLAYIEYKELKDNDNAYKHIKRLLDLQPNHPQRKSYEGILTFIETLSSK